MSKSDLEESFAALWRMVKGPELEREYKFLKDRRFKFDFADPFSRTAIEIQGGIWTGGAHVRGKGYSSNCEKYNLAALDGWTVFMLTSKMVEFKSGLAWADRIKEHINKKTLPGNGDRQGSNQRR